MEIRSDGARRAVYHAARSFTAGNDLRAGIADLPVVEPRSAMEKVNIREKLALFFDHWNPRVVGELNGQHVKLAKLQGEFVCHDHADEDEMFLVIHGSFRMDFPYRSVTLNE